MVSRSIRPASAAGAGSALDRHPHQVLERAGEEDDQRLDHHDHVAADLRHLEGELGAALVEDAEQDRRQHHADRVRAAHQRHRDADEAGAADIVEHQPVLEAHDDVQRHHPGHRAREQHGDDGDPDRVDAGIDRRRLGMAEGAHLVAEAGAPDQHPGQEGGERAPGSS